MIRSRINLSEVHGLQFCLSERNQCQPKEDYFTCVQCAANLCCIKPAYYCHPETSSHSSDSTGVPITASVE